MSLKSNRLNFLSDSSGVSVIFGAVLLLGILMLFFSAYLITAVPAQILSEESANQESFHSDLLNLFEKMANPAADFSSIGSKRGTRFFSAEHSAGFVDENGGRLLFEADIVLPPESAEFLKTKDTEGKEVKISEKAEEEAEEKAFEIYTLGSGSIVFFNSYTQLSDRVYYFGPASLILSQKDGAVSVTPAAVRLSKNESGSALISLSGRVFKSGGAPVFGNQTAVFFERLQKAEGVGFATALSVWYIPPPNDDFSFTSAEFAENRDECIRKMFYDLHRQIQSEYPDLDSVYDSKNIRLQIHSEIPIEIYFCVEEFAVAFE